MKYLTFPIMLFILLFNCSSDVDVQTEEVEPALTDVLTLELSFGDEKTITKDEFLLVYPLSIEVNREGDIYVSDERIVKVYNIDGEEKAIIGSIGQGPGEFKYAGGLSISSTGFVTVNDIDGANIFDEHHNFIKKVSPASNPLYSKYNRGRTPATRFYPLPHIAVRFSINEFQRIVSIKVFHGYNNNPGFTNEIIVHEKPDSLIELVNYSVQTELNVDRSGPSTKPFAGEFEWNILSGNRIVYTHAEVDKYIENHNYTYILHVKSFDLREYFSISQKYTPVVIPDSLKQDYYDNENRNKLAEIFSDMARKTKYFPPVKRIRADRNYIFVFTNKINEKGEVLTDVFNADSKSYITSVYFPYWTVDASVKFHNEHIYGRMINEEGFYIIEKYKIDPAVYGK